MVERFGHFLFFSSRRRHTRCSRDWSSDVCSSDLGVLKENTTGSSALEIARLARQALWSTPCPKFKDTIRVSKWLQMLLNAGTAPWPRIDRKSTRLNSSHGYISYAVFCLKKKKKKH